VHGDTTENLARKIEYDRGAGHVVVHVIKRGSRREGHEKHERDYRRKETCFWKTGEYWMLGEILGTGAQKIVYALRHQSDIWENHLGRLWIKPAKGEENNEKVLKIGFGNSAVAECLAWDELNQEGFGDLYVRGTHAGLLSIQLGTDDIDRSVRRVMSASIVRRLQPISGIIRFKWNTL
jgi:hypothetical protein